MQENQISFYFLRARMDSKDGRIQVGDRILEIKAFEDVIEKYIVKYAIPATMPMYRSAGFVRFVDSAVDSLIEMGAAPNLFEEI